jgi:cytochrome c biogenesis protein CcmG/thiol:disulfide interchange protein DsbE
MKRLILIVPLVLFAAIAGLAYVMLNASLDGTRSVQSIGFSMTGKKMPAVSLPAMGTSGTIDLEEWQGKAYAVNVFASWCGPCKLEAASIDVMAEDIPVVGINYRDDAADAAAFLDQFGNPYTMIGIDEDGSTSIRLGVHGLPETFIIDSNGIVLHHQQGPVFADDLTGALGKAIRKATEG